MDFAADFETYILSKSSAQKGFPFGKHVAVYKVLGKMFALIEKRGLNVKCDPDEALIWRSMYDAIIPYHMNKEHWNTIVLDGTVPNDLIHKMIDDSYALVVKKMKKSDRERLHEF